MSKNEIFMNPDNFYRDNNICAYVNRTNEKVVTDEMIENHKSKILKSIIEQIKGEK